MLDKILFLIDKVLKRPNIKNGFIETPVKKILKDGDYVYSPDSFGFVVKHPYFEKMKLSPFRPEGEQQNRPFEKMHCVSESACNTIETNINALIRLEEEKAIGDNAAEILKVFRYLGLIKDGKCLLDTNYVAIGSGTTRRGNTQKAVADFIRHYGLLPKGSVLDGDDWNSHYLRPGAYINGNRLPSEHLEKGKRLVEFINFSYEWVAPKDFANTYKFGALQTSAYMPSPMKNDIYQNTDLPRNHAITTDYDTAQYVGVFDSYNPFDKKFAKNYAFGWAMLYTLSVKKKFTVFNESEISKLKNRGLDYILLVEDLSNEYTNGAYRLSNGLVEKVADIKPFIDNGVIKLKEDGKLVGISRDDFQKLLN